MLPALAAVAFIVRLRAPSAENAIFTEKKNLQISEFINTQIKLEILNFMIRILNIP